MKRSEFLKFVFASNYRFFSLSVWTGGGGGGGGVLGLIIVYSVTNYRLHLSQFGQICNFRDPNLVTFYFYEVTHFLNWMKNTLLFTYSTNLLVRLLTVNMKNCLTPKSPKMCDPIIVNPVVKMRPHSAAHPHEPLIKKYPPPPPIHAELRRKKKRSKNSENIILIEADIQNLKFCRNTWLAFWTIVRLARISIKSRFFFKITIKQLSCWKVAVGKPHAVRCSVYSILAPKRGLLVGI